MDHPPGSFEAALKECCEFFARSWSGPGGAAELIDEIEDLLVEQAIAQDDLELARRRVLARRDPLGCLHQLQFWNKQLLADIERKLVNHATLSSVLRIQMWYRGKTPVASIRTAQKIPNARCHYNPF